MRSRRRHAVPALGVGQVLAGRYELREVLGGGGMGTVYRAFDRELERELAIKALLPDVATDPEFVARFRREGQALARMRHPNIIGLYDMLRTPDGGLFLLLELVDGRPLDAVLAAGAPLPWSRCAEIGIDVCAALAAAHAAGVIHRDIKPSNILVEPDGTVRVADFGVARLAGGGSGGTTQIGLSIGTPEYFSPEQAEGRVVSQASDLYSLSVVLFEASTGRLPYVSEEGARAVARMHIAAPIPDPRDLEPSLPQAAADLIRHGLAKEEGDRFSSAREMADALRTTRDLPQVRAPRAAAPPTRISVPVVEPEEPDPAVPPPDIPAHVAQHLRPPEPAAERLPEPPPPAPRPVERPPARSTRLRPWTGHRGASAGAPAPGRAGGPTVVRGRRSVPVWAAAGLAVIALAAIGGYLLGHRGDDGAPAVAEGSRQVASGDIRTEVPAGWASAAGTGAIPGLGLEGEASFSPPAGRDQGEIVIGRSGVTGPSLLPGTLVTRLSEAAPTAAVVRLGRAEALRYAGLRTPDVAGALTLHLVPTSDGVATLACRIPDPDPAGVADACSRAAAAFSVGRARVFQVDPSPAYGKRLDAALRPLERDRGAALAALRPNARAFAAMAAAAAGNDRPAFDAARRQAASADARLERTLTRLRALGYVQR